MSISPAVVGRQPNSDETYIKVKELGGEGSIYQQTLGTLNALLTLKYWELTGVSLLENNFITTNDLGPIISNGGEFINV